MKEVAGILLFASAAFIYLLPAYIAIRRGLKNTAAIYLFNLFLGWTILGWVAAFVMACWKFRE